MSRVRRIWSWKERYTGTSITYRDLVFTYVILIFTNYLLTYRLEFGYIESDSLGTATLTGDNQDGRINNVRI